MVMMGAMSDRKLVYSTDPKEMEKQKQKPTPGWNPSNVCLKLRLETKSRGGKAVTVIYDLPHDHPKWEEICKKLKNRCACGGTYKKDTLTIEIQGDHREKIRPLLEAEGFKVKG
jgi:translation initiation factor 1